MVKTRLIIEKISTFYRKKVTKFGNGAKIDCPKEYIGKDVIVIVEDE